MILFLRNEITDSSAITGGRTGRRKDCNGSSYDADNSGWRKDSSDNSDTVRADDGCNESVAPVSVSVTQNMFSVARATFSL